MTEHNVTNPEESAFEDQVTAVEVLREKMVDAMTPGYQAEFDPDEAERAGAFVEDALSEEDAAESAADLVNATTAEDDQEG